MSSKKSYNRFFIILQEEDKGYGMGPDRPPTGYVKVETKNDKSKVTVYAQNLKPFETGEYLYRCYLISHQDGKDSTAYLGIMNIDESGRGESSWESGSEDAFTTKVPIDKFNAAAIIADKSGAETVIAPLAGYMSKEKFEWRSKISKGGYAVEQEAAKKTAEAEENKNEAEKFFQYEKEIEETVKADAAASPVVEEEKPSPVSAPVVEPEAEPVMKPDEGNALEDADMEEIRGKHKHHEECKKKKHEEHEEHEECKHEEHEEHEECKEEKYEEHEEHKEHEECKEEKHEEHEEHMEHEEHEHHEDEDYYINIRLTMCKALEGMLRDYRRMEEHKGLKDCTIWKVDMEKCRRDGYMVRMYPYYDLLFYPMMYNPEVNYFKYVAKHGHYLFGIKHGKKGEVEEIIFGIRGRRRIEDQPFKGRTGFIRWISYSGDDDGYWLMMYDPITGIVNLSE